MKKRCSGLVLASALLSGCEQSGQQYLGKWQDIDCAATFLDIARNQDQFITN